MGDRQCESVKIGDYVVIQRQSYRKLHLLSEKCASVFLGKDKVDLNAVLGHPLGTNFKMIPKKGANRQFILQICDSTDFSTPEDFIKDTGSGADNRNIYDDGASQLLTSDSIEGLRDSGATPKSIVEQLVENSKTFKNKTEYSQEKYLKKKEKKYFEFLTIQRPTIRILAELFYSRDIPKTIGLRIDTLSQITTAINLQPDGTYILFENGFHGLVAATCLSCIADNGKLIHVTPGVQNQKQAVLAMNFNDDQLARLLTVRLSTLIILLEKVSSDQLVNSNLTLDPGNDDCEVPISEGLCDIKKDVINVDGEVNIVDKDGNTSNSDIRKRKHSSLDASISDLSLKKPRWALEAESVADILMSRKVDGLIIVCKEFSSNILNRFLPYLLPSRPFVVYSLYQEPLIQMYVQLKQRHDIIYLRITETWLRPYQVLPDRTHPAVTMTSSSGYLLSGIVVSNV